MDRLDHGIPIPGFMERNASGCVRQPFAETKKRHSMSKLPVRAESHPESRTLTMGSDIIAIPDCQRPQDTGLSTPISSSYRNVDLSHIVRNPSYQDPFSPEFDNEQQFGS